ncbi:MAG: hypothetical protein M3R11_12755 [Acidobacteriota bacterium]|nr:hypothetical protein [Acidobacteriota bacterium]
MLKRIHRRLPPKKVKFYFEVWLCALSSTLVYSCGGETADETNLNDALNRASEADLPALGLKRTTQDNRIYWIPDQN